MATTTSLVSLPPQRVPVGSFRGPNANEVQVSMSQPWYKALQALAVQVNTNTSGGGTGPGGDGLTIDAVPAYAFGELVYRSSATAFRAISGGNPTDVLHRGDPGQAPSWGALPALSMPVEYAVANGGDPVAVTWNAVAANLVLAGPASGAAAIPGFRALVAADVVPTDYLSDDQGRLLLDQVGYFLTGT